MHFTVPEDLELDQVWDGIMLVLDIATRDRVSSVKSNFYMNLDGLECELRGDDGSLIAICYSESDRMGSRRWTVDLQQQ